MEPIEFKIWGYNVGDMVLEAAKQFPYVANLFQMISRISRMKAEIQIANDLQAKLSKLAPKKGTDAYQTKANLTESITSWTTMSDALDLVKDSLTALASYFQKKSTDDNPPPVQEPFPKAEPKTPQTPESIMMTAKNLFDKITKSPGSEMAKLYFAGDSVERLLIQRIRAALEVLDIPFTQNLLDKLDTSGDRAIQKEELDAYIKELVQEDDPRNPARSDA